MTKKILETASSLAIVTNMGKMNGKHITMDLQKPKRRKKLAHVSWLLGSIGSPILMCQLLKINATDSGLFILRRAKKLQERERPK